MNKLNAQLRLAILAIILLTSTYSFSTEKVDVKLRSRAMVDLGYFDYNAFDNRLFPSVYDLRMGAQINAGNITFKADIGLDGKQIGLKDVFVDWRITPNDMLRFGNIYAPFSIENLTSNLDLSFNHFVSPTTALASGRRLGVTYFRNSTHYHGAVGVFSDNDVNTLFSPINTSTAITASTRHLYRTTWGKNNRFQIGAAATFRNIDQRDDFAKAAQAIFSTKGYANMLDKDVMLATVKNAKWNATTGIETYGIVGRMRWQAEYMWSHVARNQTLNGNIPSAYNAHGGYLQLAFLLNRKGSFRYDPTIATGVRSGVGSVEMVMGIDYTDLNSEQAEIYGGEQANAALGVNWFFHKLFALRWSANYSFAGQNLTPEFADNGFSTVLRVQFSY